ncbi:MAG: FMN-binding protein [Candidatus Nanopelagicales bacterium]
MKRALLVSTGTVAGLVTVLVLNPTSQTVLTATAASAADSSASDSSSTDSGSTDSGAADSGSGSGSTTPDGGTGSSGSGSGGSGAGDSGTATGTYEGDTIQTRWGPVQVQAVVEGGSLTDVQALQLPSGDHRSYQISVQVEPMLREQALAAQSAAIDGVSGATYTSDGYARSLASALDRAGL